MATQSSSRSTARTTPARPGLDEALADLPPRVRVHELARRAGLNSKETIAALAAAGISVASASSSVDQEVAENLLTTLLGGSGSSRGGARKPAAGRSSGRQSDAAATSGSAKSASAKSASSKSAAGAAAADSVTVTADGGAADAAATDGEATRPARSRRRSATAKAAAAAAETAEAADEAADDAAPAAGETAPAEDTANGGERSRRRRRGGRGRRGGRSGDAASSDTETETEPTDVDADHDVAEASVVTDESGESESGDSAEGSHEGGRSRRRRRRGRSSHDTDEAQEDGGDSHTDEGDGNADDADATDAGSNDDADDDGESGTSRRRRRRRRHRGGGEADGDDAAAKSSQSGTAVQGVKGSTRLEAKRQRRRDSRETRRRPQILSEAEFLARRESVDRVMAVRQRGDLSQVALLEDGVLVEHFVSQHGAASMIGNVYVGRVQNVLPSMEAAFVDIGKGRNAVLYAGEVNWDIAGLEGKERRIETALASGDTVLVQVSKDPIGHKGARLTTQISLPGRFLVFVPGGGATGISRKLPDGERKRLKKILDTIVPAEAGVIIRTAAEGVGEEELAADVARLQAQWEEISEAARKATDAGSAPKQLYAEPDTLIKVVRDLFNSDINRLLIDGDQAWASLSEYVLSVAPELADRVSRYIGDADVFAAYRIDEQITKALQRKVRLPSGGSLVIDRTEAMTVIDVNTGKFTGSGGNLEETVTRNNLEAAEEIVRQLRLRDIGGIIVVDFIDMVLESNRDLVLRRLTECLGRDRTRHQVAEVTSLGLVQMTRKRMGLGLVETFSEPCATCSGRGIVLLDTPTGPAEVDDGDRGGDDGRSPRKGRRRGRQAHDHDDPTRFEPLVVERVVADAKPDPRGPKPPVLFRSDEASSSEPAKSAKSDEPAKSAEPAGTPSAEPAGTPSAEPAATASESGNAEQATASVEPEVSVQPTVSDETSDAGQANGAVLVEAIAPPLVSADLAAAATTEEVASPRPRRRRAAARPAGAPASAQTAVDLTLPTPTASD